MIIGKRMDSGAATAMTVMMTIKGRGRRKKRMEYILRGDL
jgi:hypothetical protein